MQILCCIIKNSKKKSYGVLVSQLQTTDFQFLCKHCTFLKNIFPPMNVQDHSFSLCRNYILNKNKVRN